MKISKKIVVLSSMCIMLITSTCFASKLVKEEKFIKDDIEYIYKTYISDSDNMQTDIENLEKEILLDKKQYVLDNTQSIGGDITESIDINTQKKITVNTNNTEEILKRLGQTIPYNKDGFIGEYQLDINTLNIESKYNGYVEHLVEETKKYSDLATNDLINIPKQIYKDGLKLDLITTTWNITDTTKLQSEEIPSKYQATCYYATKKRVDNPITYLVTADYNGKAQRVVKNPVEIVVAYKCITKQMNTLPYIIASGGTTLIVIILLAFVNNIKIYNYQDNKWKLIKKKYIVKPFVDISNCQYKSKTNKYRLELSNKLLNKFIGKMLTVKRGKNTISLLVNPKNNISPNIIEIIV